jgi:hypothetical protein
MLPPIRFAPDSLRPTRDAVLALCLFLREQGVELGDVRPMTGPFDAWLCECCRSGCDCGCIEVCPVHRYYCRGCGKPVERERQFLVVPMCLACLPPPDSVTP